MPCPRLSPHFRLGTALLFAGALALSCTKKADAPAPAANDSSAAAPTAAAPKPATAPAASDVTALYAQTEAALKANELEKATQAMLSMHQGQLNEAQAQAARGQMVRLQSAVAAGVAAGDPKALAAAELLRRSAMAK